MSQPSIAPPAPIPSAAAAAIDEASPRQVQEWLRLGRAVLIDVREPDEHAREWIDGSRLIPLSRFSAARAVAEAAPGQRIVVHCRGGRRGADACRSLIAAAGGDVRQVSNMAGGIEAWKAEGLPVGVNLRVSRIGVLRQVQLVIGLCVLAGSALAWFVHPGFVAIPAFFGAGLTFAGATGTCALASLVGAMPWNRLPPGGGGT